METIEQLSKVCNVCEIEKPITDFYFRKESGRYRANCKKCKPLVSKKEMLDKLAMQTVKVCKECGIEKSVNDYQKAGGGSYLQPYCKPCDSERKKKHVKENEAQYKESRRAYRENNLEQIKVRVKVSYEKNKESILKYHKEYGVKNKALISEKNKAYREENKEYCKERDRVRRLRNHEHSLKKEQEHRDKKTLEQKANDKAKRKEWELKNRAVLTERYKERKRKNRRDWCNNKTATDISFRILKNLRGRTRFALKRNSATKIDKTENLLGCTIAEFKAHFESLFTEGMTWEAFMAGEIHIDHKRPCSLYNLEEESQQRECFNFANLQPLWKMDNLKKSNKYE